MTRPAQSQIDAYEDDGPKQWTLVGITGYMLRKNGVLVTCCLALIAYQITDKRQRDEQVMNILLSNAKILSDLTGAVRENDLRDQKSLEEMKPTVTRIESVLSRIENRIAK
ncbi:MAG: hypothetical protein WCJ66_07695 [Verrucomicrobiota bacterium]